MAKSSNVYQVVAPVKPVVSMSMAGRGSGLSIPSFRQRPRPGYQTSSVKVPKLAFPISKKAF